MSSVRSRAPSASSPFVRRVMRANLSVDTEPESRFRSIVHQLGLRFRKDARPEADVKCKADIVFRSERICVFLDGCFWHGCPSHFECPKTHSAWWREKIDETIARDRRQARVLRRRGWTVLRLWEHDINADLDRCVRRLLRLLQRVHCSFADSTRPVPRYRKTAGRRK